MDESGNKDDETVKDGDWLKEYYYKPSNIGSLGGMNALSSATQKNSVIKQWLPSQRAYTLHAPVRRRMPEYRCYNTGSTFFGYQFQADLCEMPAANNYRYILTVVDMFSRFAYAVPLTNKTGVAIKQAFNEHIFTSPAETPIYLQTDLGKEFYNSTFINYLKEKNVKLFSVKSPMKAALVERFNRTLKARMYRYFTYKNNKMDWPHILSDLLHSYNNAPHRSLPKGVTPQMAKDAIDDKKVINQIHLYSMKMCKSKHKKSSSLLQIGDSVRLSKIKHSVFSKGFEANWSEEIFTVSKISLTPPPIMYTVTDYKGNEIEGKFYRQELQKVTPPDEYPIEKIIRRSKDGKKYLVKFLGYDDHYWVNKINSGL
jgi:hypothetical protein